MQKKIRIDIWNPDWILVAFCLFGIIYFIAILGDFFFPDPKFIEAYGSVFFSRVSGLVVVLPVITMATVYLIEIIPRIIRDDT